MTTHIAGQARRPGPLHVCFCVDEVMAMPLGAALASILTSRSPDTEVEFHVIQLGLGRRSRRMVDATVAGQARLNWYDLSKGVRRTLDRMFLQSERPYPPSAYARVLAGRILPPELDRVIYLDADVIAVADLAPLWNTDLDGAALAGVHDVAPLGRRGERIAATLTEEDRTRFGYRKEAVYFSSGVLVIDLPALRAVEADLIGVLGRYPTLSFPDQDAFNIVLGPRARLLDHRWNQTTAIYWDDALVNSGLSPEALEELRQRPWVVHFSGRPKPWEPGCAHAFLAEWQRAHARTPWAIETGGPWRRLFERGLRAHRVLRKRIVRRLPLGR